MRLDEPSSTEMYARVLLGAFLLLLGALTIGCVQAAPIAPSPLPLETTTVLVRTLVYGQGETPLARVHVLVDGRLQGQTGADGLLTVTVPLHCETTIDVRAEGYRPAGAAAVVHGPGERWSFWLEGVTDGVSE